MLCCLRCYLGDWLLPVARARQQPLACRLARGRGTGLGASFPRGAVRDASCPLLVLHELGEMHTVWVRLNAVVFFGLTVLLGLSCLAAISKLAHRDKPSKQGYRVAVALRRDRLTPFPLIDTDALQLWKF
jgi:hypothetical protein